MARLRTPAAVPAPAIASLTAAEDTELRSLAVAFTPNSHGDHSAPLHIVRRLAAIAGGPVEDFTGPLDQPMPIEMWTWAMPDCVDPTRSLADRVVSAIQRYRAEAPAWWVTKQRGEGWGMTKPLQRAETSRHSVASLPAPQKRPQEAQ